ncbi:DnaJ domain-containing protein [Pseudomaricurvus sp. HS19]|uniref:DnaJ domain-containing protein n=1 Tax=Pseudomaricurvus sp. HS19 TaxID=2692626 RepID=UPI00136D775D|nr:molecular chaperone DnaJ [Pseudomaricurvus sp. HS19]
MFVRVILLAVIVFLLLSAIGYLKKLPPEKRRSLLLQYGLYLVALLAILLVLTGRLHWIGAVVAALFAVIKTLGPRLLVLLPVLSKLRGSTFANPVITTRYLRVSFNLKNRSLSGEVIAGEQQGRKLEDLTDTELQQLVSQYQRLDPESARLLSAYIYQFRRQHGSSDGQQQYSSSNGGNLDRHEALQILGLADDASREDIIQAHRRLMQKLHPDRGGSDYLAAKINQAKDFLLKT